MTNGIVIKKDLAVDFKHTKCKYAISITGKGDRIKVQTTACIINGKNYLGQTDFNQLVEKDINHE